MVNPREIPELVFYERKSGESDSFNLTQAEECVKGFVISFHHFLWNGRPLPQETCQLENTMKTKVNLMITAYLCETFATFPQKVLIIPRRERKHVLACSLQSKHDF